MSSAFRVKNEARDGLVRQERTGGESLRYSRYAVSGLLCPNFCVHLSAHPLANPGTPLARTHQRITTTVHRLVASTITTAGIPCHQLSFLKAGGIRQALPLHSLCMCVSLSSSFFLHCFAPALSRALPLFRTEVLLFLLTVS